MSKRNESNSVFTYLPHFEVCSSCRKPILPNTRVRIKGFARVANEESKELPLYQLSLDDVAHEDCPNDDECDILHQLAAALSFVPEVQRFWRDHYLDSKDEELNEEVTGVGDGWGLDTAKKDLAHEVDAYVGFFFSKVMRVWRQMRREMFSQEEAKHEEEGN